MRCCPASPARTTSFTSASIRRRSRRSRSLHGESRRRPGSSVQFFTGFGDTLGQQVFGGRTLHRLRQDGGGGRDRRIGGSRPHIGECLGFRKRDLVLGGLGAPRDKVLHLGLGFGRDPLGLRLRRSDDVRRLALRSGATRLVFGEQFCSALLETLGVFEFGPDALAAMVERGQYGPVNSHIGEQAHQDDEGDRDPEFRLGEHRSYPFKDESTARSTDLPSGATPVSRCTRAAAASAATPRTLLIAFWRVAAMVFSASFSLCDKRSSSALRSASDAAFSFSRFSAPIAWARERAAASSVS